MISSEILSKTDATRWERIMMVARYYMPYLRGKLLAMFIMPVVCEIILSMVVNSYGLEAYFPLGLIFSIFFIGCMVFSPMLFARSRGLETELMLPALPFERKVVIFSLCFVIVPVMVFVPSTLLGMFVLKVPHAALNTLFPDVIYNGVTILYSVLTLLVFTASCLWGVMAHTTHRVVWGIAYGFFAYILLGFIGLVGGVIWGFMLAFNGYGLEEGSVLPFYNFVMGGGCIVSAIGFIFAVWRTSRAISRMQI